jgi:two-component system, OmpR family, alkaline phosphatase synthesis response regulator PhoP
VPCALILVNILVAEDDRDIADLIVHYIQKSGWSAHVVSSGSDALAYARRNPVDLAVLDVMMPGLSGLEVCRALRSDKGTAAIPIIMVTARTEETDRIMGLELGADDYLAKPFNPNELVARIRAIIRRSKLREPQDTTLRFGPIVVDLERHTVSDNGRDVKLTAKEFMLLQYLLEHRGRVLSRDLLLGDVWGYRYTGGTRTVDVHVRRLREKLPALIEGLTTVKQFGYKLVDTPLQGYDGQDEVT